MDGRVHTPLALDNLRQQLELTGEREHYEAQMAGLTDPEAVARIATFMVSDEAKLLRGTVFRGD